MDINNKERQIIGNNGYIWVFYVIGPIFTVFFKYDGYSDIFKGYRHLSLSGIFIGFGYIFYTLSGLLEGGLYLIGSISKKSKFSNPDPPGVLFGKDTIKDMIRYFSKRANLVKY